MIGRIAEQDTLRRMANSDESEFVAVYGRRRVGKTYLIRETFEGEFTFAHSGLSRTKMRGQLQAFRNSLKSYGHVKCPALHNWLEAFEELKKVIAASPHEKKVVFIDEMPWMDTPRSSFVPALEFFWNSWASARKDILLVICGSATSWIIDKIIRNHGGLHGRVTEQIALEPFTLAECERYADSRGLQLSRPQIAELYMVFGGVPFYWHFLQRGMSPAQSVDELVFSAKGKLRNEFADLYESLFKTAEPYVRLVTALGRSERGLTRDELGRTADVATSGHYTRYLEELEQCGFLMRTGAIDKRKNESVYRLVDPFTLFWLRFDAEISAHEPDFWTRSLGTGRYHDWRGYAFEVLCLRHVTALKCALQIGGLSARVCAYRDENVQIDLILDRQDGIIDLCEMKFTDEPFALDEREAAKLVARRSALSRRLGERKSVHIVLVSANGLKPNKWSNEVVKAVSLNDLFVN